MTRRRGRPRELDRDWGPALQGDWPGIVARNGRWTKRQAFLIAIRSGLSTTKACKFAGVAESVFYDEQASFPEFADQVARARERTTLRLMLQVQAAAATDWKAADRALQLIDPDEYGNRLNIRSEQRTEIVNTILVAIGEAIDSVGLDSAVRLRIAEAIGLGVTQALGGGGDPQVRALPPHVEPAIESGGLGDQREPSDSRGTMAAG